MKMNQVKFQFEDLKLSMKMNQVKFQFDDWKLSMKINEVKFQLWRLKIINEEEWIEIKSDN